MTLPALLLGFLLSTLYGAAFHFWRGGGAGRFLLYLALAWLGFWAGDGLATAMRLEFLKVGPLHVGLATLGSAMALFIGHWLSKLPDPAR
jgi:hypothetical protein